ncbi:MAG: hypothetical protein JNL60_19805 [Bacteroidia bacterium]|nr:hypothetical protein [Bacteroidia bacterium]
MAFGLPLVACKKAGTGGKASVAIYVKHHNRLIPGALVYIKFNEKEFPGVDTELYDMRRICGTSGESEGHTHLANLKQGYYYFYATGYDTSINETVSGGIPLHIRYSQRKDEINLDIAVTE